MRPEKNKGRDERRDLHFASYLCIIYVEVLLRAADIAQDATHTTRIALELNVVYTVYYRSFMLRENNIGVIACAWTLC